MYKKLVHANAAQRRSALAGLERASKYFERAKELARLRRRYEAGVFYAKAQRLLKAILRRNGVRDQEMETGREIREITDEQITRLMERAWQSMNA
ncbi:MAG: hypothetical protein M1544_00160 [Candidatus Marsarchaeota archaeon]|nr:hypothetical protein [Candidatus Marsarchaeota archaeon]MCL5101761.1 hypothetical protein [Candidatus Marsarchaeota archaeon]